MNRVHFECFSTNSSLSDYVSVLDGIDNDVLEGDVQNGLRGEEATSGSAVVQNCPVCVSFHDFADSEIEVVVFGLVLVCAAEVLELVLLEVASDEHSKTFGIWFCVDFVPISGLFVVSEWDDL